MNRISGKMTIAAAVAAFALTFSAAASYAQQIYVVESGRTTLTMSPALEKDFTTIGATVTAVVGSQLLTDQVYFPITSGAISLETADGQMLHSGGVNINTAKKQVRLDSFIVTTTGEESYVTALVVVDGRFQGRIKIFDVALGKGQPLPLDPKVGDLFLSLAWNLDPEGAAMLNDAFGTKVFTSSQYAGYSLSLFFVPLNADGK